MGTFYNELNCSSLLTRVSGTISLDGPSFSESELLAASVASESFMDGAQDSRKSFCTFSKSGSVILWWFVTMILPLLLHCPLAGECYTPFDSWCVCFFFIISCFVSYLTGIGTDIKMVSVECRSQSKILLICVICSVPLSHSPDCIWTNGGSCSSCSS